MESLYARDRITCCRREERETRMDWPEELRERPRFTRKQVEKELKKVLLLDRVLAERGALTLKELHVVTSEMTNHKGVHFKQFTDLTSFVRLRTNAFEVSFDLVRNHSQEFREMFGYLVNFLCGIDQSLRNVKRVLQAVSRFDSMAVHEVGSSEEDVRKFLLKHKNFFIVQQSGLIVLNPTCLQIPSAWEREALPSYKNIIRYDKSIILDGIGKVVSAVSNTRYIKIEIVRGPRRKQTVYGLSKNVSNEENLAEKYPVGTLVKVLAYRAYEAAHPWTATKVILADDRDDIWSVGETGRMDSLLAKYQYKKKDVAPVVTSYTDNAQVKVDSVTGIIAPGFKMEPVNSIADWRFKMESVEQEVEEVSTETTEKEIKMSPDNWKFYNDVICDEMKRNRELDKCLRNGPRTFQQIFTELIERPRFQSFVAWTLN